MKEKAPYGIIQSLIYSMLGVIALCAVVLTASAVSNASLPGAKAFPALDRNLDGFLDRREAADSPSLMAVFGEVGCCLRTNMPGHFPRRLEALA